MPLYPINLVYLGDLYRFYIDRSQLPSLVLSHIEFFESGYTHCNQVDWASIPLDLKEMLLEKINLL